MIISSPENEKGFLKQFDSWELSEQQRQEVFSHFLLADDYALEASEGHVPVYEHLLENFERLVREQYHLTSEQAIAIKTEGFIKEWASLHDKKIKKSSTFFSRLLSFFTKKKEGCYETEHF